MSGSSSLASELSARLSHQIDLVAASLSEPSSSGTSTPTVSGSNNDEEEQPEASSSSASSSEVTLSLAALTSSLSSIRHQRSSSLNQLKADTDQALNTQRRVPRYFASDESQYRSVEQLQWIVNAHLAVSTWRTVLDELMNQAEKVKEQEDYWQSVEGEDSSGMMYLVQTMPVRIANALRVLLDRLQIIASSPRPPARLFSYTVVKRALPPSLLITSLFPHLSAKNHQSSTSSSNRHSSRSLFFLTFSPLLLTRQEVYQKRKQLKDLRHDLARRIGGFVKDSETAQESISAFGKEAQTGEMGTLGSIMGERIAFLESSLAEPPSEDEEGNVQPAYICEPLTPSELLVITKQTQLKSLVAHNRRTAAQIYRLSRPSWLTRSWPWLISTPIIGYYAYRKVYNSRASIQQYYNLAKETARGFLVDWVVDPCIKILETLRHGDDQMAIMGRESLKSDFDSLERMVADFAKDQKMTTEEVLATVQRVRQGDMTVVLGAYEKDLKSPLKSAVAGTLVRTLLIQVQKVKVDVDLAMDGIEKMLKSQQLTFAFVGVAPSMVLLYFTSAWLRRLFTTGPSSSSKAFRKRVWYTMRAIDRILTSALDTQATPKTLDDVSTGLLLIELSALREYAASTAFPTRDRSIKSAFLDDVRDLERGDTGLEVKIRVFDRLTRGYDKYLRL